MMVGTHSSWIIHKIAALSTIHRAAIHRTTINVLVSIYRHVIILVVIIATRTAINVGETGIQALQRPVPVKP